MQNNTTVYSDIFRYFRTIEQIREFYEKVDEVSNLSFTHNFVSAESLVKSFPTALIEILYPMLQTLGINEKDPVVLKQFLVDLKEIVEKAKIADVTLAIVPDRELVISLSNHLREALNDKTLLLSLKTDSRILGGIELIWSGRYWNLGLEKQIDEWLAKKLASESTTPGVLVNTL